MIELLRTIRIVGLRKLLRLSQARRWGWDGILRGFYTTRTRCCTIPITSRISGFVCDYY